MSKDTTFLESSNCRVCHLIVTFVVSVAHHYGKQNDVEIAGDVELYVYACMFDKHVSWPVKASSDDCTLI